MGPIEILLAILGISLLVIIHESGHYLAARAFGMRVLRYSIGLGPPLIRWQKKGSPTVFQVCAIPFLAYVQIDGMNPTEEIDRKDPALYANKGVFARIVTVLAGPAANYVAASVLYFLVAALAGLPADPAQGPMLVGEMVADMPAAQAGMQAGDEIFEANGQPVHNVQQLIDVTRPRAGQATVYRVHRGEQTLDFTLTPVASEEGHGRIGVSPGRVYVDVSVAEAATQALIMPVAMTAAQIAGLADMISRGSTEELRGPVGMVRETSAVMALGWRETLLILTAISIALGFFNLLPLPALDGGRLAFLLVELVTRRRANERVEAMVHAVGVLILLGAVAFITYRDIFRG